MTPADLLVLFAPEFATADPVDFASALALGLLEVQGWDSLPQTKRDEAQALYAAWILTTRGGSGGGGGVVTSGVLVMEQAGDTKRQWATSSNAAIALTPIALGNYWARFLAIRSMLHGGPLVTGGVVLGCAPYPGYAPYIWW